MSGRPQARRRPKAAQRRALIGAGVTRKGLGTCSYCGERRPLTVDHVVPKALGGRRVGSNTLHACQPCNGDKAGLLLPEWLERLRAAADPRAERVARLADLA